MVGTPIRAIEPGFGHREKLHIAADEVAKHDPVVLRRAHHFAQPSRGSAATDAPGRQMRIDADIDEREGKCIASWNAFGSEPAYQRLASDQVLRIIDRVELIAVGFQSLRIENKGKLFERCGASNARANHVIVGSA